MELPFLLLLWGLSDPRMTELREMPRSFSIKLHSETQVSGRLGMSGGGSPRHYRANKENVLITHHALSPPPSHHHLYIINLINWLQSFYRITMSLERPFVLKKWRKAMIYYYYTITITSLVVSKSIRTTPT